MFREMRRKQQLISAHESESILKKCTSGVLGVSGDGGYPYTVPLSYVYDNSKIYFHCAKSGHKLDAINNNNKVSFCVTEQDDVVPEKYTTYFRSVICFGRARIIEDDGEKQSAVKMLAKKYSPDADEKSINDEINSSFAALCMVEIDIEHMTGKEAIELTRARG